VLIEGFWLSFVRSCDPAKIAEIGLFRCETSPQTSPHAAGPAWLELALADMNARRVDGKPVTLEEGLPEDPVLEFETNAGELKIVPEPAGTRGYDDLRRDASREPLGSGLRPSVASLGDAARMLAALGRDEDVDRLRTLRRVIELESQLGLGLER
jgi:hypothetical protein